MAERLADKYEEAKEKQEDIMNRWVRTTLFHHRPLAVVQQFASVVEEMGRRCHPSLLEDWASEIPFPGAQCWFWVLLQVQAESGGCLEMPCETGKSLEPLRLRKSDRSARLSVSQHNWSTREVNSATFLSLYMKDEESTSEFPLSASCSIRQWKRYEERTADNTWPAAAPEQCYQTGEIMNYRAGRLLTTSHPHLMTVLIEYSPSNRATWSFC